MRDRLTKSRRSSNMSLIRRLRGKYKHLPLMETLREMKREEKQLNP